MNKRQTTIMAINKHKLIYMIFIFIASASCSNEVDNTLPCLKGNVEGITIDHVINERDGCRFPSIYLDIAFENTTLDSMHLDFTCYSSFCTSTLKESNLMLSQGDMLIPLALFCKKERITIYSRESIQIKFRIMEVIEGQSLNDMIKHYESLLYEEFVVLYKSKNKTFEIEKSSDFKINLLLDDKSVSVNDTLMLNKTPVTPDFKSIEDNELLK